MQKLAGIKLNENSSNSMINEENDYTFFDTDFKNSPDKYLYYDMLNMIKSLENEKIPGFDAKDALEDFKKTFEVDDDPIYIHKGAYEDFINDYLPNDIKKSYLSKWIELGEKSKKKLNENDDEIDYDEIDYDDENFSDSFIDDEGFDDDFDLNRKFKKSQSKHSYDEVLEIIKSYENMLNDFKSEFPKNELVYAVVINDGEYEQVIYIKNVSDKDELKKIALSKTEIKPHKKIKITKLGVVFSELDDEEKELFKNGDVAVFEPESMD